MPFCMLLCTDGTPAFNWAEEEKKAVSLSESSTS